MTNRIEQAARALYEDDTGKSADDVDICDQWELDQWRSVAATLHNAGLLATREEWATRDESDSPADPTGWKGATVTAKDETQARDRAWSFGYTVYRRFVTEWEAVE